MNESSCNNARVLRDSLTQEAGIMEARTQVSHDRDGEDTENVGKAIRI